MTTHDEVPVFFRALFLIVFIPLHTALYSIITIILLLIRIPHSYVEWFPKSWARVILFLSGIRVQVCGEENRPQNRGFIYLFTHSNYLDIPVLVCSSKKFFSFGAKSSLFRIPFFGQAMTLLKILPITRENRQKAIQVYNQAEKRLANGEIFALSPEGGRRKGHEIGEFKSGPFIFAINAKVPVVPIVLCGVDHCLKRGSIFINTESLTRKVGIHILPAIETSDLTIEDTASLKEKVRKQILKEFESMKKIYPPNKKISFTSGFFS